MRYLFAIVVALFLTGALAAQVHGSLKVNIGTQPIWGPTGNDHVDNYYLPDIETYYNVPTKKYYYNEGGKWKNSRTLPSKYSNYDLYNSHKVVVNENQPWKNHADNQTKYASFKGQKDQQSIRDSKDSKYFVNKNHPQHNAWVQQQKQGNGNNTIQNKGNTRPSGPTGIKQNNGNKGNTIIQFRGDRQHFRCVKVLNRTRKILINHYSGRVLQLYRVLFIL